MFSLLSSLLALLLLNIAVHGGGNVQKGFGNTFTPEEPEAKRARVGEVTRLLHRMDRNYNSHVRPRFGKRSARHEEAVKRSAREDDDIKRSAREDNYIKRSVREDDDIKRPAREDDAVKRSARGDNAVKRSSRENDDAKRFAREDDVVKRFATEDDDVKRSAIEDDDFMRSARGDDDVSLLLNNLDQSRAYQVRPRFGKRTDLSNDEGDPAAWSPLSTTKYRWLRNEANNRDEKMLLGVMDKAHKQYEKRRYNYRAPIKKYGETQQELKQRLFDDWMKHFSDYKFYHGFPVYRG